MSNQDVRELIDSAIQRSTDEAMVLNHTSMRLIGLGKLIGEARSIEEVADHIKRLSGGEAHRVIKDNRMILIAFLDALESFVFLDDVQEQVARTREESGKTE